MLIECFGHNYYSKDVKLMRIIISNMLFLSSNQLTSSFSIFSCGQKSFEMNLTSQKCVFDKQGLWFKSSKNQKYFKNYFVKESSSASSSTTCNFCWKGEHISSTCPLKNGSQKNSNAKAKKVWTEKSKVTNP